MNVKNSYFLMLILISFFGYADDHKVIETISDLQSINVALTTMRLDIHRNPSEDEGFALLTSSSSDVVGWKGPYLDKKQTLDSWGSAFIYKNQDGKAVIYSIGPNRVDEGGISDDVVCGKYCR